MGESGGVGVDGFLVFDLDGSIIILVGVDFFFASLLSSFYV